MRAVSTPASRRAVAHDIIDNDGDIMDLTPKIEALHSQYLALRAG